jgi:hypothetical protein
VERVLVAAGEGDEETDVKIRRKAEDLREAMRRRVEGLKKLGE